MARWSSAVTEVQIDPIICLGSDETNNDRSRLGFQRAARVEQR